MSGNSNYTPNSFINGQKPWATEFNSNFNFVALQHYYRTNQYKDGGNQDITTDVGSTATHGYYTMDNAGMLSTDDYILVVIDDAYYFWQRPYAADKFDLTSSEQIYPATAYSSFDSVTSIWIMKQSEYDGSSSFLYNLYGKLIIPKTIQGGALVDSTLTVTQLADDCVETAKIKDENVTDDKLANDIYMPFLLPFYLSSSAVATKIYSHSGMTYGHPITRASKIFAIAGYCNTLTTNTVAGTGDQFVVQIVSPSGSTSTSLNIEFLNTGTNPNWQNADSLVAINVSQPSMIAVYYTPATASPGSGFVISVKVAEERGAVLT